MVAIFDIDGTLCALSEERERLLPTKEWLAACDVVAENWNEYHRLAKYEQANEPVKRLLQQYAKEHATIIISTGRPECYREMTEEWLARHGIKYKYLFMRSNGDLRHSHEIKRKVVSWCAFAQNRIAVEDRQQDIDMYLAEGFKVIRVKEGQIDESK